MRALACGALASGVLLTFIVFGSAAKAAPITFDFTGTVTSADGIWAGQGTAVTGFYTYDTTLVDSPSSDPTTRQFHSFSPTGNQGLPFEISVTVGTVTRTTANNQNALTSFHHFVEWLDRIDEDRFRIRSNKVVQSDDFARIMLKDLFPGAPSGPDGVAVGTGNLAETPITTAPDIGLFDTVVGQSFYDAYTGFPNSGTLEGQLTFTLLSVTAVPEPSTGVLVACGLVGLVAVRRRTRCGQES